MELPSGQHLITLISVARYGEQHFLLVDYWRASRGQPSRTFLDVREADSPKKSSVTRLLAPSLCSSWLSSLLRSFARPPFFPSSMTRASTRTFREGISIPTPRESQSDTGHDMFKWLEHRWTPVCHSREKERSNRFEVLLRFVEVFGMFQLMGDLSLGKGFWLEWQSKLILDEGYGFCRYFYAGFLIQN